MHWSLSQSSVFRVVFVCEFVNLRDQEAIAKYKKSKYSDKILMKEADGWLAKLDQQIDYTKDLVMKEYASLAKARQHLALTSVCLLLSRHISELILHTVFYHIVLQVKEILVKACSIAKAAAGFTSKIEAIIA